MPFSITSIDDQVEERLQGYVKLLQDKLTEIKEGSIPLTQRRGVFLVPMAPADDKYDQNAIMAKALELNPAGITMIDFEFLIDSGGVFTIIVYRDDKGNVGYAIYGDKDGTATAETMDGAKLVKAIIPDDLLLPISRLRALSSITPIVTALVHLTN